MIADEDRRRFEALAQAGGDGPRAAEAALRFKAEGSPDDLKALAAFFLHAAAAAPERLPRLYDAAAEAWLGTPIDAPPVPAAARAPEAIPPEFWEPFWALAAGERAGGAAEITQATAALTGHLPQRLTARIAHTALAYPGVAVAAAQGYPHRFTMKALARCPAGSLGGEFHALIVENGFDLEVLDREALGLSRLPTPLDYLNARILQCHDLWHILAGYRTTGLHEVAISGFQLAQFGHGYSAMFLAMVVTRTAFGGSGSPLMLDTILSAWAHGRRTPPLLGLDWEGLWDMPVEAVRAATGVSAYVSPWPPDLFESMRAA